MQQFIAWTLDRLVAVTAFVALCLHVFLLSDENDRDLLDSKGVGDAIIFFEMRGLMQIVEDGLNWSWFSVVVPLSEMDEQTGRNLP